MLFRLTRAAAQSNRLHQMRIVLLGTAAGGGFPQWNCSCALCAEVRTGSSRLRARTQSCVAISADDKRWFLLNASPDARFQLESFRPLQPPKNETRGTPIEAVLLTNADLDHTLGLLLMREGERLVIHSSSPVQDAVRVCFGTALESFCGTTWILVPKKETALLCRDNSPSGLTYSAFSVSGKPPRYAENKTSSPDQCVGYRFTDEKTGGRLVFVPDIAQITLDLIPLLSNCDVLLFDGTFWSEHEMSDRGINNVSASQMGHVPISGDGGSLKTLAALPVKNRVYIHINNTNPILLEDSPECAAVGAAGLQVGCDGMEFLI
jgi:pyrroloquinoline quinone biosynthesis protein B